MGPVAVIGAFDGAFRDIVGTEALGGRPDVLVGMFGKREGRMARQHRDGLEVGECVDDLLDRTVE
ncbi:MAG: hypothetical protein E5X64_14935, partial [Mesorhizobium sp.]